MKNWWLFLFAAMSCATISCGGGQAECSAGEFRSCDCPDGSRKTQACVEESWGTCACPVAECSADADCGDGAVCDGGVCTEASTDADGDGIVDDEDNCPDDANADQADSDSDGIGDVCEVAGDDDGDGILDADDNCPDVANEAQDDRDSDGVGDLCDDDRDGDDVPNADDNCPDRRNANQTDSNGDGVGDACDRDGDGVIDDVDNCPDRANADQADIDQDDIGNVCDGDDDGDGLLDGDDNCPSDSNDDQTDTDTDGVGDACDTDDDGDGISDDDDNCPLIQNATQDDRNANDVGDICDDPDNDGVPDSEDNCPDEANPDQEVLDGDADGLTDCYERSIGTNPAEVDSDGDGIDDNDELSIYGTDPSLADSDGDTLPDGLELAYLLDPVSTDTFNDGINDANRPEVTACSSPSPASANTHSNTAGGWTVQLPSSIATPTELTITGANATNGWSASLYNSTAGDISGFVAHYGVVADPRSEIESLVNDARLRVYRNGSGDKVTRTRRYVDTEATAKSLDAFRNDVFFRRVPWRLADATNLPADQANTATDVVGYVSLTTTATGTFIAGAFADATTADDQTFALLDVLTDGTNVDYGSQTAAASCSSWSRVANAPELEMYWVLSQNGNMFDDLAALKSVSPSVFNLLNASYFDYRMGVTSMDQTNAGRLTSQGWHTTAASFDVAIDEVINGGASSLEYGLQSAVDGVTYFRGASTPMVDRARVDAGIVTVIMSDAQPESIQLNPLGTAAGDQLVVDAIAAFEAESAVYTFTAKKRRCFDTSEPGADAYRRVAFAVGGTDFDICTGVTTGKLEEMTESAFGAASLHRLFEVPITSTMQVKVDGNVVTRSTADGYEYFPEFNSVVLFGTAQPTATSTVVVEYETF